MLLTLCEIFIGAMASAIAYFGLTRLKKIKQEIPEDAK